VSAADHWSEWLRGRRDGGNERQRSTSLKRLESIRDRVLDFAEPLTGAAVLDIGSGDGLIGLAALDRVGPQGSVTFCDISAPLLEHAREAVRALDKLDQARFVLARAEDLAGIPDASVDVASTRSVLIYVADKQHAFDELYRVLVPDGRISLFEPINRLMFPEPEDRFWGYHVAAVADLAGKVKDAFAHLEHADAATMMDFDERDLFAMARRAGFASIHLELHTNLITGRPGIEAPSLETLLESSPHPLAPTLRETVEQALDTVEQARFLSCLGTALKRNDSQLLWVAAFLVAHKTTSQ
jgi:ubiquinone/menaquinone biosynthesis C-methylase UbiE